MTASWRDELRVLDRVGPTRDLWADALTRAGSRGHSPPPSRRRLIVALAIAGLVAAAAAGFGISLLVRSPGRSQSVGPGRLEPGVTTLGVNPFGESGKLVTLQQFVADKAAEGYDVPLPDSPLANSTNVGSVWESTTGAADVYYPSSGIQLNYGGTGVDYTGFPAEDIQMIDGVRAIVLPASSPDSVGLAEIMLPLPSGHLVTLYSNGSLSDLVSVAKTMPINGSG